MCTCERRYEYKMNLVVLDGNFKNTDVNSWFSPYIYIKTGVNLCIYVYYTCELISSVHAKGLGATQQYWFLIYSQRKGTREFGEMV